MKLFGKKKEPDPQETTHEIFGGFTITKAVGGYEIKWRSPNLTTLTVHSSPAIDGNVQATQDGDTVQILSQDCKLRITTKEGKTEARISRI